MLHGMILEYKFHSKILWKHSHKFNWNMTRAVFAFIFLWHDWISIKSVGRRKLAFCWHKKSICMKNQFALDVTMTNKEKKTKLIFRSTKDLYSIEGFCLLFNKEIVVFHTKIYSSIEFWKIIQNTSFYVGVGNSKEQIDLNNICMFTILIQFTLHYVNHFEIKCKENRKTTFHSSSTRHWNITSGPKALYKMKACM